MADVQFLSFDVQDHDNISSIAPVLCVYRAASNDVRVTFNTGNIKNMSLLAFFDAFSSRGGADTTIQDYTCTPYHLYISPPYVGNLILTKLKFKRYTVSLTHYATLFPIQNDALNKQIVETFVLNSINDTLTP